MLLTRAPLEMPCCDARLLSVVPDCRFWLSWLVLRPSNCAVSFGGGGAPPPLWWW